MKEMLFYLKSVILEDKLLNLEDKLLNVYTSAQQPWEAPTINKPYITRSILDNNGYPIFTKRKINNT